MSFVDELRDRLVDMLHDRRWEQFSDPELREIRNALATAPALGSLRSHDLIAAITIEALARGEERALAILDDGGRDA